LSARGYGIDLSRSEMEARCVTQHLRYWAGVWTPGGN